MPFAMTHLYIAKNIINETPCIKKPNDFLLGALAPDSVHFRNNYNSDMKFKSHLCVGNEKWGRVTNNDVWLKNVLAFLEAHKDSQNADFIYGYCCHIVADIQNNKKIWMPYMKANKDKLQKGGISQYHQECCAIDNELYLQPQRRTVWTMLENAASFNILDIANKSEINQMKQSILHNQFEDIERADVSNHQYVTLSNVQKFIREESAYIKNILYGDI